MYNDEELFCKLEYWLIQYNSDKFQQVTTYSTSRPLMIRVNNRNGLPHGARPA
jgi:hypothetical protein